MREMKDSGTLAFGTIPSTWKTTKFKNLFFLRSTKNTGNRELLSVYLDKGVISYSDSDGMQVHKPSESLDAYQNVEIGDFVLNNQQAWRGSVGVSKYRGIISPAYFVYSMTDECYAPYMNYLLRDSSMVHQYELASRGVGTIQRNLFAPWLKNRIVLIPPICEQKVIANFLDSQCSEIDAISADIQKEIETLEQYKRSVITEAVTKGLNPDVEMKNSGLRWCEKIPATWEVIPAKYLFHNSDTRKFPNDELLTASQKYGLISQTDYMKRENAKIVLANAGIENWKHVEPNDFVISLRSFQGGLEMSEISGCVTWHYVVLRAAQKVFQRYYKWLFKSSKYINALQATCNFIRDGQDLRFSNFAKVPLFIPPYKEQCEIAAYLDEKTTAIDAVMQSKKKQIEVLDSYKKSLIYEYVTGKKEVVQ